MHAPLLVDLQTTTLDDAERELLAHPGVAGICLFRRNLVSVEQGRELVEATLAAAGRALLIAIDQEGGAVVRLPQASVAPSAMALGAADDPTLTERLGAATGRGVRRIGVNVDFAPVADVQSNPANPVIAERAFGADPHHVARHVAAFVRGLQGTRVAATLKHFPGHGDVGVDSHLALPRLDADAWRLASLEWPPFEAGIAVGAAAVMSAHVLVPALDDALPATLSRALIEGALRDRLGFDGVVFSDALDMRAIADRWGADEAAVLALAAGVDVPVACNRPTRAYLHALDALERASRDGRLDPERVRRAAGRVAALLERYPNGAHDLSAADAAADASAEAEAARRAVTAVGEPVRLTLGTPVALLGRRDVHAGAASDAAAPVAALGASLETAGVPVRWYDEAGDPTAALDGAQALLVASAERTPWTADERERYRSAVARAAARGVPALHVALWNPSHVRDLDLPALVSYGFRPASVQAVVDALLGAPTPGRAPLPLRREGASTGDPVAPDDGGGAP